MSYLLIYYRQEFDKNLDYQCSNGKYKPGNNSVQFYNSLRLRVNSYSSQLQSLHNQRNDK
jgi:hypothetical protein